MQRDSSVQGLQWDSAVSTQMCSNTNAASASPNRSNISSALEFHIYFTSCRSELKLRPRNENPENNGKS